MDPTALLTHALAYGLVLSAALSALVLVSIRLSPESWLGDYPEDIQESYGPMSPRGERLKWIFGLPILITPLLFSAALLLRLHGVAGTSVGVEFWRAALAVFVMGMTFNLIDLVVIDWLIFVYVQPDFVVLPGTEGLAGYKDYYFHFRAFLVGTAICAVTALVASGLYRLWVS